MVLDHHLSSVQPQSFLKWIRASIERSIAKFYAVVLQEHVQVALEILEVLICSSTKSPKIVHCGPLLSNVVVLLAKENAEVQLHALQTMTKQF
jgi:hypothetical protein